MEIVIRLEETKDFFEVEQVTRRAFSYPERIARGKIGCPLEHYMVHQLRENEGIKELSFVAEVDGGVVGYIIYSKAHILCPDGSQVAVLNFGPLGVLPEYQRKGVGSKLMSYSIQQAKALGHGAIFFFGRPEYYPRFGFVEAETFGITTSEGDNFPAFMGMELQEGYLQQVTGRFIEPPIFDDDLNRTQAKAYDQAFFEGE